MKKSEIVVGGVYTARVSSKIVPCRVDAIKQRYTNSRGQSCCRDWYEVTNLKTGRKLTFHSAQKFRGKAAEPYKGGTGDGPESMKELFRIP